MKKIPEWEETLNKRALVSVSKAAQLLGYSRKSIYNLIQNGSIKTVRLGDKSNLMISTKQLREMLLIDEEMAA